MRIKLIDRLVHRVFCLLVTVCVIIISAPITSGAPSKKIRIGIIEGGSYPQMESFRQAFRSQLVGQTAGGYEVIFLPKAFFTAEWNRATSQEMAQSLTENKEVDIILALGPWVVQDLLAANCKKPIIAVHQFDPVGAGLLNDAGRPIAENLALGYDPTRIRNDLYRIKTYSGVSRLGLLHFPGGGDNDSTVLRVSRIAGEMGMEVVSADGFDNNGTYAFFKAFRSLPGDIDALYISPLWGLGTIKTSPFFDMVKHQRLPLYSFEGRFQVSRGAMVGFGSDNMLTEAYFYANQVKQIMNGATPADLPVLFQSPPVLTVDESLLRLCRVELSRGILLHADRLGSSELQVGEYFNLQSAISQAQLADASLLALHKKLDESNHEAAQLRAEQLPQLNLDGSLGWVSQSRVENSFNEVKKRQKHITLRLEQSLLNSDVLRGTGRTSLSREATISQIDSARGDLSEAVSKAYYDYLKIIALEELLNDYRRRLDLFEEFTTARQQLSSEPSAELQRWHYERRRATKLIFQAETAKGQARTVFNLLLSQAAETSIKLDTSIIANGQLVTEYSEAQKYMTSVEQQRSAEGHLVELAQSLRAKLLKHTARFNSAAQRLKRQRFSFLPDIGVQATLGWADSLTDRAGSFREEPQTWSAGLKFDWPLFKGGKRFIERKLLNSWLDRSGYEADVALLEVVKEVRLSAQSWFSSFPVIMFSEENSASADVYLTNVTELYLAGQTESVEMTAALDSWLEVRVEGLEARYEYYSESATLLRAIGGTMDEHSNSPGQAILWYLSN